MEIDDIGSNIRLLTALQIGFYQHFAGNSINKSLHLDLNKGIFKIKDQCDIF